MRCFTYKNEELHLLLLHWIFRMVYHRADKAKPAARWRRKATDLFREEKAAAVAKRMILFPFLPQTHRVTCYKRWLGFFPN
jgi:hypothetical protein